MKGLIFLPLLFGALVLLSGCASVGEQRDETAPDAQGSLTVASSQVVGQSFVARHAGLQAIELYVGIDHAEGNGNTALGAGRVSMVLHLRSSALPDATDLRIAQQTVTLPLAAGWRRFVFEPIAESHNQQYYVTITSESIPGGLTVVRSVPGVSYHDGSLYIDSQPQDAQLALRLGYDPISIAMDLAFWLIQAVLICTVGIALFILPGLALQIYVLPLPGESWRTRLGISVGLSLSLYPLILVWMKAIGYQPGALTVWTPVGLAFIALAWRVVRNWHKVTPYGLIRQWWLSPNRGPDLVFICVVALVIFVRLFLLRSLDGPMWGDSVQHSMISQLIVDKGGLFESWSPFVPYDSLTVHPGFHTIVATIMWATGQTILGATTLGGQIVNVLAILALLPVANRIFKSSWAGTGVVIVAGLLAPLPNGYINWGRYPQLMGEAIAPIAMWFVWFLFEQRTKWNHGSILLGGFVCAGTFLAYYRMPHYVVIFTVVLLVFTLLARSTDKDAWRKGLVRLIGCCVVAVILALPWLLRLRGSALGEGVDAVTVQPSTPQLILQDYRDLINMAEPLLGGVLIVATLVVVSIIILVRHKPVLIVAIWGGALLMLPATRLIRVAGLNNLWVFAVLISLYIPMGLLIGYGIDWALQFAQSRQRMVFALALIVLTGITGQGVRDRLAAIDSRYRILAPADLSAMEWIRQNIPPDALILVDGFLVYDGRSVVGSDGGWWIPLLTQRKTTMPPQYPLLAEHPSDPNYNALVVDTVTEIRRYGLTTTEGLSVLCRYHITHVYTGQEQGRAAIPPPSPMASLTDLESSKAFTELYRQNKVGIFRFDTSLCR